MATQPITFAFAAELFTHGSWGARDIGGGAYACTMTWSEGKDAGSAFIEWDIPGIETTEEIGLTFTMEDGRRVLDGYDGIMSLPTPAMAVCEQMGCIVPAEFKSTEGDPANLSGDEVPQRMHPLQAERFALAHECTKTARRVASSTKAERAAAHSENAAARAAVELFDAEHAAELAELESGDPGAHPKSGRTPFEKAEGYSFDTGEPTPPATHSQPDEAAVIAWLQENMTDADSYTLAQRLYRYAAKPPAEILAELHERMAEDERGFAAYRAADGA